MSRMALHAQLPFADASPCLFGDAVKYPERVFSIADARRLFARDDLRSEHGENNIEPGHEHISLVRDCALVPEEERADSALAHKIRDEGATAMFRWLHTLQPSIREVCQHFADHIGLPVHANAYWTPPNSQGLPFHADFDSVFVAQTYGQKTWLLFRPRATSEHDENLGWIHEGSDDHEVASRDKADYVFTTRPGQVLWLPRGWGHRVCNEQAGDSVHVSFGLLHPEIPAKMQAHQFPVQPRV